MLLLYRTMRAEADRKPAVGASATCLGARPGIDLPVEAEGLVRPRTGGMSVTADDPREIDRVRRPRARGGESRHPLFLLDAALLPVSLACRPIPPPLSHHAVEPTARCPFEDYQAALASTRDDWRYVDDLSRL